MRGVDKKVEEFAVSALMLLCFVVVILFVGFVLREHGYLGKVSSVNADHIVKKHTVAPSEQPELVWGELQQDIELSDAQIVLNYPIVKSDGCVRQASAVEYAVKREENVLLVDLQGHDLTRVGDICASVISYDNIKLPVALTDPAHLEDIVITLGGKRNHYAVENGLQLRPVEVANVYLFGSNVSPVGGYTSVAGLCENNEAPACHNLNSLGRGL